MKRILVTGSSGTIGTRLCEKLINEGYSITGVDNKPNKWNKQIQGLTINLDLRDKEKVMSRLPNDFDLVIHLAANARVYNLVKEPSMARDNLEILFNVLEFTRLNNIKKVMFSSSREVYGNSNKIIHNEEESFVKNCESPYTASKIGGEALIHSYQQCYGLEFIIFRFSNVYGMYDDSDRVIPLFIRYCEENKDLIIYGKDKLLDFTHVDDVVKGILQSIRKFEDIKDNTFNIAYGQGVSIMEVAQLIRKNLNSNACIVLEENRTGEVVKYIADISKARKKINYDPKIKIDEGIKKTINWYKQRNNLF
ncbi:MAG: SDR family NAD(P)-dependent oxidoreductase [Candidatus Pacearchaeota archaeon]